MVTDGAAVLIFALRRIFCRGKCVPAVVTHKLRCPLRGIAQQKTFENGHEILRGDQFFPRTKYNVNDVFQKGMVWHYLLTYSLEQSPS